MVDRKRVLVLDAGTGWGSLVVLRSLGPAGYESYLGFPIGAPQRIASSRYCHGAVSYPDPSKAPRDFQQFLVGIADRFDYILPIKEPGLLAAAAVKKEIEARGAILPIADASAMATATRKVEMLQLAEELGIRTPRTIIAEELPSQGRLESRLGFPFIMKASTEIGPPPAHRHHLVATREDGSAAAKFDDLARYGPVILQEYVEGFGAGVGLVYSGSGAVIGYSGHRRLFEQFSDGGPSVIARTFVHPAALADSRRLLEAMGWKGIAMVEFRIDPRGSAVFMEVNPRVWGTMSLAIASGVDFPRLLLEAWKDPLPVPATPGRRRNYFSIESLLTSMTSPPAKRPSRGKFTLALAENLFGLSVKELQGFDPRPGVMELFFHLRSIGTRHRISEVGNVLLGPAVDYRLLARRGVHSVVDLRTSEEVARRPLTAATAMTVSSFPVPDDTGLPPERFRELTRLLARAAANGPLYVHCRQGKGRAPMAVIGYLVSRDVPLEEAFQRVYAARPATNLNAEQRTALYLLDRFLHPAGAAASERSLPPPPPIGAASNWKPVEGSRATPVAGR